MGGSSRSSHSKTKNGCGQCKKRHVRCSLQAPKCDNCKRRNEACDYELLAFDQMIVQAPARPLRDDTMVDATVLGSSLLLVNLEPDVWNADFVPFMIQYDFFRQSMLAVAAAHSLADRNAGIAYHIEASRLFRSSVVAVSEENWVATIGFIIGAVGFNFSIDHADLPRGFLHMFFVLRGSGSVVCLIAPWFVCSALRFILISRANYQPRSSELSDITWNLSHLLAREDATPAHAQSIMLLLQWVATLEGRPMNWLQIIGWPASVSSDFVICLEKLDSLAVIIFIYWCTIINYAPKRWFWDGWSTRIVLAAINRLGIEWDIYLEWPRRVLNL